MALALRLRTGFYANLQGFLLVIAYWLAAYSAIMIIEHVLRRGKYPVEDYESAHKLPVGIAAIVSMVLGLAVTVLGVSQQAFTGPIARHLRASH